jgi:hypothetical protein
MSPMSCRNSTSRPILWNLQPVAPQNPHHKMRVADNNSWKPPLLYFITKCMGQTMYILTAQKSIVRNPPPIWHQKCETSHTSISGCTHSMAWVPRLLPHHKVHAAEIYIKECTFGLLQPKRAYIVRKPLNLTPKMWDLTYIHFRVYTLHGLGTPTFTSSQSACGRNIYQGVHIWIITAKKSIHS